MTRRVLVVEPDPSGRMVVQRALSGTGHVVTAVALLAEARGLLDAGQVRLAIIDEAAGSGQALDDVRRLRGLYPRVPVVVTGTLLSQRVLLALMRLGVAGALLKPFSPEELAETVEAALSRFEGDEGLEYVAARTLALHALGRGRPEEARAALGRARAVAPLEAEVVALSALVEELRGHDTLARRGYLAALTLGGDDFGEGPDARAGLARLDAYERARPVERLGASFRGAPLWPVADEGELRGPPPCAGPLVVALGLGLEGEAIYLRQGPGPVAFALLAGGLQTPALDHLTDLSSLGPRVVLPTSLQRLGELLARPSAMGEDALLSASRSAP